MRIDANLSAACTASTSAAASVDANGWLAALEQGCIDLLRQDDAGPPRGTVAERPAAVHVEPKALAGSGSSQAPAPRAPAPPAAAVSSEPTAAPGSAAPGIGAVRATPVVATSTARAISGNEEVAPDAPRAALPPLPRGADDAYLSAELDSAPAATASEVARAPAPEYARQRMQLTPGDMPLVALRDAALPAASAEGVARAIAAQLREDGQPSVRVFVNGRRFDFAGPASDALEARQPADLRHDQEA